MSTTPLPASPTAARHAPRSPRSRRVRWIIGIAVGLVLVVLTVGGFASGAQRAGATGSRRSSS